MDSTIKNLTIAALALIIAFGSGLFVGRTYLSKDNPELTAKVKQLEADNANYIETISNLQKQLEYAKADIAIKYVPVEQEAETIIKYVERQPEDKAAVKVDTAAPDVTAVANGKEYKFPILSTEKAAFENGQLVINQKSTATLDITEVVNEQLQHERQAMQAKAEKDKQIAKRQGYQKAFYGCLVGAALKAAF